MEINNLNADVVGEIIGWLDDPSAAVFVFVVNKRAFGRRIMNFDAIYLYSPAFVHLFFNFVEECLCKNSARVGNLELLKWARLGQRPNNVCYWDSSAYAAKGGSLEVLNWARIDAERAQCPWDSWTCADAAGS